MKRNNLAYFKYRLLQKLPLIIALSAISLFISYTIFSYSIEFEGFDWDAAEYKMYYNASLFVPAGVISFCAFGCSGESLEFFKKRRNLDCIFAMPISRRALGVTNYLVGLITILVPYTLCFIENLIFLISADFDFKLLPLLPAYFVMAILGALAYSIYVFLINEANTLVDSVIFCIFTPVVFSALCEIFSVFTNVSVNFDLDYPSAVTIEFANYFSSLVTGDDIKFFEQFSTGDVVWSIFWITLGVGALVAFLLLFDKKKTEKTEEASESFFGYRVVIPILTASMIASAPFVLMSIFALIFAALGYTLFRRGLHYKKEDYIVMGALVAFAVVCVALEAAGLPLPSRF